YGSFYAGSPQVKPERATQFELGLKGEGEGLHYAASLFRNRISNYLTGMPLTGAAAMSACGAPNAAICKQNANLGSVVLEGLEAQM
ncbi:TonB-dependent receptor, partial [Streptococcus pyogenes]